MWLLRGRFSQTTPEAEVHRPQNARRSCFGPILLALSITRRDWTKKPDVHNRSVCRANTFAARRSSLCASVQQQHRSVSSTYNLGNKDPFLFVFFLYFPFFFSFFFFFHPFFLLSSPIASAHLLSSRLSRSPCLLTYSTAYPFRSRHPQQLPTNITQFYLSLASPSNTTTAAMASVPPSDPKSKIDLPPNSGPGHSLVEIW